MMRVLHIGQYYPPYPGGIETYTQVFCEGLSRRGANIDAIVSNNKNEHVEEHINGVNIYRLPRARLISSRPYCPTMPSFVKKMYNLKKYDIIHLHYPNPMAEMSYFLADLRGYHKLFLTYHADSIDRRKEAWLINLVKRIHIKTCVNYIFKKCSNIILTSSSYCNSRITLQKFKNKCQIISIPVDPFFLSQPNQEKVNILKDKFNTYILYVGNFVNYKGIRYLIEAMKYVDANLVLIGTGIEEQNLRNIVNAHALNNKVHFVGRVVKENGLKDYYDACTLFCLPSLQESYGIVLLEAMACEKPVISTDLKTGTSIVNSDGETGFIVSSGSPEALAAAMNKILSDEKLMRQMGKNAKRKVVENFTVDKMVNELYELYNN